MQNNEDAENKKMMVPLALYAILTWFWFQLNNADALPIIGHTELVHGWVDADASKMKLLFDLIYFAVSVAVISVATDLILSQVKLPFVDFKIGGCIPLTILVYFVVMLYEFHVLEFRLRLISLLIALIIFLCVGMAIYGKIMTILIPILKITDVAETISDVTNITDHDDKK